MITTQFEEVLEMFCVTLSGKERYCSVLNNLRHANYRPSHSTKDCGYMHERPNLGGAFKVLFGSWAALYVWRARRKNST